LRLLAAPFGGLAVALQFQLVFASVRAERSGVRDSVNFHQLESANILFAADPEEFLRRLAGTILDYHALHRSHLDHAQQFQLVKLSALLSLGRRISCIRGGLGPSPTWIEQVLLGNYCQLWRFT